MLVPVLPGYRHVCDVRLLGVELRVLPERHIVAGAVRESLSLHRGRGRRRGHLGGIGFEDVEVTRRLDNLDVVVRLTEVELKNGMVEVRGE